MGELLVKSMVLLCAYAVLLSATPWVRSTWPNVSTTVLSLPVIALFGAFSYRFIRATGWPLSRFGLGFKNALGSILEAAVLTPVFAVVLIGVKWLMVRVVPAYRGLPTIEHTDVLARLGDRGDSLAARMYRASALCKTHRPLRAAGGPGASCRAGTTPILRGLDVLDHLPAHVVLVHALAFLPRSSGVAVPQATTPWG